MLSAEDRQNLRDIQDSILEMVAYGESLASVADALCRRVEAIAPGAVCSVLAVDPGGLLRPVAAPSLPNVFAEAVDGLAVGPRVGSCGTAAWRREPVVVTDIATDPLWEGFRDLALPNGLLSSWSSPITARGGRVIGTFALYFTEARAPTELEREAVTTCLHVCAIALERAEIEASNRALALYDPLTGLPNRLHADQLIRKALQADSRQIGLLVIDVDKLKVANETLGHEVGDAIIRTVAKRIAAAVRPASVCRIGGDEFAAIIDGCGSDDALEAAARRVLDSMEAPLVTHGHSIVPHVTIGGALHGRDGTDIDELKQNADLALHESKETGRGRFSGYSPRLRATVVQRARSMSEVEAALNEGRLIPHYQPLVRLDTQEIIGLEALARIRTTDGRIISAGQFAEALREPRIVVRLTSCMLRQVACDMQRWLDAGIPLQHVGVNISMADFQTTDVVARIEQAFGGQRLLLEHLVVEVTETVLVGDGDSIVAPAVERLRGMGLRVALDDFGTGFASLTHLLTLPADVIKIDRCFVNRPPSDEAATVIVSALVDIATKLGMRTVAEGIETVQQANRLSALGCELGQGFHFFRPASFEETTRRLLLRAQRLPDERLARRVA